MLTESLVTGDKEVSLIYEAANIMGVDVIKLVWKSKGNSVRKIVGFDVPTRYSVSGYNPMAETDDVPLIFDAVKFFPDKNGFRWGYVLDTEKNRKVIMGLLSTGFFHIQDKSIRDEIVSVAEKKGIRTTPAPIKEISVRKTVREEKLSKVVKSTEDELRRLKAELAKKEEELQKVKKTRKKTKEKKVEPNIIEGENGEKIDVDSLVPPVINKK